ncbi:hypothetical protein F4824DRAFT_504273 [Ustulina deusta]|nr:hypothetical protein F4824DRAFT_504273 [Ustulina deusta]
MSVVKPITCAAVDFDGVGLSGMYVALDCSRRGDGTPTKFESFTNEQGVIEKWFRSAEPLTLFQSADAGDYERISITFSTAMYFGRLRTPWVTIQANVNPSEFDENYVRLQFGAGNSTYSVKTMSLPFRAMERFEPGLDSQTRFNQAAGWVEEAHMEQHNEESSGSIGSASGQNFCSTATDSALSGLLRTRDSSALLSDPLPPSPSLSVSTLDTVSEAISPLILPSPQLPIPRSLRVPRTRSKRFSPLAAPNSPSNGQGRVTRSRKRKATFEDDELEPPRKRRRLE